MKTLNLQTPCPCCQKIMTPASLTCPSCQVKVEGPIASNEFASLPEEELHLLRVFVWAEGRVKDMEGPLGLSYPTIRTRLAGLKEKLRMDAPKAEPAKLDQVAHALDALDAGELDFEQTLELLKKTQERKKVMNLEKIIAMAKAGKITEAQAAELIRTLNESEEAEEKAEGGENSVVLSKVDDPKGQNFRFDDNDINVTSLSGLALNESSFSDNSLNACKMDGISLEKSSIEDCSFNGSKLDDIAFESSRMEGSEFHGTKISALELRAESSIRDTEFHGVALKGWRQEASTLSDAELHGAAFKEVSLKNSQITDFSLEGASWTEVELTASKMHDIQAQKTSWKNVKMVNSRFADINFESNGMFQKGQWENVTFTNCDWSDLYLGNYEIRNVSFENVNLRDLKIEGVRWEGRTFRSTEEVKLELAKK